MGLTIKYEKGQTPLNEEEKEGLLISSITTKEELDEFEQQNIEKAYEYYLYRRKFRIDKILTESFVLQVHVKMFDDVWRWAGQTRYSEKNIGVPWVQIPVKLRQLLEDCKYWIENESFSEEEISIRLKHRLVAIHIFPNGNGRHSRLMGDIIMMHIYNKPKFSWGQSNLKNKSDVRNTYINALKKADADDYNDLIAFARS